MIKVISIIFYFLAYLCPEIDTAGVQGFDLGAEFFKISVISPGKSLQMAENQFSKTKTPTAITFYNGDRVYETEAVQKQSKKPENAFNHILKLFGKKIGDEDLKNDMARHYDKFEIEDHTVDSFNSLSFPIKNFKQTNLPNEGEYLGKNRVNESGIKLLFEEIGAMILQYASQISNKYGGTQYTDAVYTVPPWWGPYERSQLVSMAELAGLKPISLVSENTGSAVKYAFDRQENKKINMLLYNMGADSTKVSLVSLEGFDTTNFGKNITKQSLTVLGESWENRLGGYELDICLANMIADRFDQQSKKPSIKDNAKIMLRVIREAKRFKEILSANKFVMIGIEELAYDIDFQKKIERSEFETECGHLFEKVVPLLDEVLLKANVTASDLDLVEIIGGGVRIPYVQDQISQHLKKDVNMHLNGDDSMALGTSLIAANMTNSFRVVVADLYDGPNYEVKVNIKGLNDEDNFNKSSTLFKSRSKYSSKKLLNIKYDKDLLCELVVPSLYKGGLEWKVVYEITDVAKNLMEERVQKYKNPTVSLGFLLNSNGIPGITKAELVMEEHYIAKKKVKKSKEQKTEQNNEEGNKEEKKEESTQEEKKEEGTQEEKKEESTQEQKKEGDTQEQKIEEGTQEEKKEGDKNEEKKADEDEYEEIEEPKTRKHAFPVTIKTKYVTYESMNQNNGLFEESKNILKLFKENEEEKKKVMESKNKLEGLIYIINEQTGEEGEKSGWKKFATDEELEDLKKEATDQDDWFFSDEAMTATYLDFDKKYNDINKKINRVNFRKNEDNNREDVVNKFQARITQSRKNIEEMKTTRPWIEVEKIDKAQEEIDTEDSWLKEKIKEQDQMKPSEDPVLQMSVVKQKTEKVRSIYEKLRLIKKPLEKKEDKKEETSKDMPNLSEEEIQRLIKESMEKQKNEDEVLTRLKEQLNKGGEDSEEIKKILEEMRQKNESKEKDNEEKTEQSEDQKTSEEPEIKEESTESNQNNSDL